VPISSVDATLGCKIDVPTVHGDVELSVPAGTQYGQRFRLKSKGVKSVRGVSGDQIVEIKIEIPTKLSKEEIELYEKIKN
ncbi:MAG: DnaJ C-terminal domain-containing protein, partial [Erysipelotrichaceae bacterium]